MAESGASVSFACQRCLQPLRLSGSLGALSEHALAELQLGAEPAPAPDRAAEPLDHCVPAFQLADAANGFMLVSDGDSLQPDCMGKQMMRDAKLFDTLSNNSDVDHPLCDECTDSLLQLMDKQLELAEAEWKDYNEYLKKIEDDKDDLNIEALQKELDECKREERRLLIELEALQKEERDIETEIMEREREKERLAKEDNVYLREYTRYQRELINSEDQAKYYESRLTYTQSQLVKLKNTNVFKVAFVISDSENFGIINNFRLGRLPKAVVDWSEINAAWGQTALLLSSLARKINFTFKNYNLVPYGNHSYIEVLEERKELPLFGSGNFKLVWDTKFDAGMVAFLDCMQQFQEEVIRGDPEFKFPYKMDKGKLEDSTGGKSYSIKIQFNSEEQWTKALKFLLTNLKWGLTWVASQFLNDSYDLNDV